jgi:photosystem II stability/assembly factor-like uncharacterized protein
MPRCVPCGDSPRMSLVTFADERTGWLAGGFGVARTADGGKSWQLATTPPPGPVLRASFSGSSGVAVGEFEGVAVSGDGGATWRQYRPIPGQVTDVQAMPGRLLASTAQHLYASTDGGIVWKKAGTFAGSASHASRIHFSDATHGTAATAAEVAMTHDAGRTWAGSGGTTGVRNGVFTRDATTAFAVGVDGAGPCSYSLRRTTDGGTLSAVSPPTGPSAEMGLVDVGFAGDTGYAVGWEGALLRSTDAGATWVAETPPASYERVTFRSVSLLSADRAVAVTYGGGLVSRDSPAVVVSAHPFRGAGLGLLGVAALALVGGGVRAVTARPDAVAISLIAAGVVAGAGGGLAVRSERDEVAGRHVAAREEASGADVIGTLGSYRPVVPTSAPPSASASASATPTPSVSVSVSASPTATPSATPTPARTTQPPPVTSSPTRRPTTPPPTTKPPGKFTVTPAKVAQQCDTEYGVPSFAVQLKNTTSKPVAWDVYFVEQGWATTQQQEGTVPANATTTIYIYPDGSQVCTVDAPTDFHLQVRSDTAAVLGTVTDRVTPP